MCIYTHTHTHTHMYFNYFVKQIHNYNTTANIFNPKSNNSEIITTRCLRRVVPKTGSCAFYQQKVSVEHADLREMFKKSSKSVCSSTVVVSPDPPSPTPLISSAMNTPENTQEYPDDLEPPYEGDIQMEYSSAWLYG